MTSWGWGLLLIVLVKLALAIGGIWADRSGSLPTTPTPSSFPVSRLRFRKREAQRGATGAQREIITGARRTWKHSGLPR